MAKADIKKDGSSSSWKTLCDVDDLKAGSTASFIVDGKALCLVRTNDNFYCIDDTCSHEDYPLSSGDVDIAACEIECSMHGSVFSLLTGEPQNFPATKPVDVYQVQMVGQEVQVLI